MLRFRLVSRLLVVAVVICGLAQADKKKKDDDLEIESQTKELLPQTPAVSTAETARLAFHFAPASHQGLLSQELRTSLRAAIKKHRRDRIVHLRAYVAGSGDTRRVRAMVSEVFTGRRHPLPSVDVIQVGQLPVAGAEVMIEMAVEERKPVNPHGLLFLSGQPVSTGEAVLEVAPAATESVNRLKKVLTAAGLGGKDVVSATCFCSSLHDGASVKTLMQAAFPNANLMHVQLRRAYSAAYVSCDAIARLRGPVETPITPQALEPLQGLSFAVAAPGGKLAFTASHLVFGHGTDDARLAMERLNARLAEVESSLKKSVFTRVYPLYGEALTSMDAIHDDFFPEEPPQAGTLVFPEGVPSLDASLSMSAITVIE
jgi:enamine deaminase RidA (YjgF/YER057c/UK114 family)